MNLNNIVREAALEGQKVYIPCPLCSDKRDKQGTKSLMIFNDEDAIRFECIHPGCEIHGKRQWIPRNTEREEINVSPPEFVYPIPIGNKPPEIPGKHTLYKYRNSGGELLFYKVRIDKPDGSKMFWPLSLVKGGEWVRKMPPIKTWYGLEDIDKSDKVILVEGEKARDRAKDIFTKAVVLAWPGGSANKIDPSYLEGKEVTIWPDNDEEGLKQAKNIATQLPGKVYMVDTSGLPPKTDLGDDISEKLIEEAWNQRKLTSNVKITGSYDPSEFTEKFKHMGGGEQLAWPSLDKIYLPRSGMIIVEGRSGHGKTTMMINILSQYIDKRKDPLVFFSYEMPAERILLKLVMLRDGRTLDPVPYINEEKYITEIVAGKNEEYNKLLPKLGTEIFITDSYITFTELLQDLSLPGMNGSKVFIDYLQYIPASGTDEDNRYLMIKMFAEKLQNIANKNNLLIFAGAQLTPAVNAKQDSPREGKDIHNAAELVLRIWNRRAGEAMGAKRDDLKDMPGDVFIEVRKNRNGWVGNTSCFYLENGVLLKDINNNGEF